MSQTGSRTGSRTTPVQAAPKVAPKAAPKAAAVPAAQRAPAAAATAEAARLSAASAASSATTNSTALAPNEASQGHGSLTDVQHGPAQRPPAADSRQPTEVSDGFLDDALSGLFAPPSYRAQVGPAQRPPTDDLRESTKGNNEHPEDDALSGLFASPSHQLQGLAAQMEQPFSADQMASEPLPVHIPVTTHLDTGNCDTGDLDKTDPDSGNLDRGNLDSGNLGSGNLGEDYPAEDGDPFLMPTGSADAYFDADLPPPFRNINPSDSGPRRLAAADASRTRDWGLHPAGQMFRKEPHSGRHASTASIDPEIRSILDGHREVPDEFGTSYVAHSIDGEHTFPQHSLHRYHYTANTFPRSTWDRHDFNQSYGSTVQHPSAHSFAMQPTSPSYALRSVSSPRGPYRIGGIMQLAAWDSSHRSHGAR